MHMHSHNHWYMHIHNHWCHNSNTTKLGFLISSYPVHIFISHWAQPCR